MRDANSMYFRWNGIADGNDDESDCLFVCICRIAIAATASYKHEQQKKKKNKTSNYSFGDDMGQK